MNDTRGGVTRAVRISFGVTPDGRNVEGVELSNSGSMTVRLIALGAGVQSLCVPDRQGVSADVVLGHDTAAEYLAKPQYLGVTVGRYANRIARGRFTLGGRQYQLDVNDGANHLHGGAHGADRALWRIESIEDGPPARVVFTHVSADGEGGYPGEMAASVTYALHEANELAIEQRASASKPTIVSLSNHSYYNLAGEGAGVDVLDHRLTLFADRYTPTDETQIPTGELRAVGGTAFDFTRARAVGERIRDGAEPQLIYGQGYDHNFVVRGPAGVLRPCARLEAPESGRVLELLATAPGLQLYSGNQLDGTTVGKSGRIYRCGDGLCLEPQHFPDAPNHANFPSPRLDPGNEYVSAILLKFSAS